MIVLHLIRSQKRISMGTLVRHIEELRSSSLDQETVHPLPARHTPTQVIDKPAEKKTEEPTAPASSNSSESSTISASGNEMLSKSRYDTLLRFAAVELEGIIKKE
jgi:hypothetical protein